MNESMLSVTHTNTTQYLKGKTILQSGFLCKWVINNSGSLKYLLSELPGKQLTPANQTHLFTNDEGAIPSLQVEDYLKNKTPTIALCAQNSLMTITSLMRFTYTLPKHIISISFN